MQMCGVVSSELHSNFKMKYTKSNVEKGFCILELFLSMKKKTDFFQLISLYSYFSAKHLLKPLIIFIFFNCFFGLSLSFKFVF